METVQRPPQGISPDEDSDQIYQWESDQGINTKQNQAILGILWSPYVWIPYAVPCTSLLGKEFQWAFAHEDTRHIPSLGSNRRPPSHPIRPFTKTMVAPRENDNMLICLCLPVHRSFQSGAPINYAMLPGSDVPHVQQDSHTELNYIKI